MPLTSIERITAEQLVLASQNAALPRTVRGLLYQAAQTIQEMDKDMAVMQVELDDAFNRINRYR